MGRGAARPAPYTIHVVGESWSGRAYELREALGRCAIPHSFCLADSATGAPSLPRPASGAKLPLVVFPDGTVLADPSNADLARASGSPVNPERMDFDLVIVGAGPAGLSAAVYGASEGFSTLVVDEGGLGGQATSSSLIRNYLGFPRGVSGRRLAQQAYEQAWVFGANFAFMQRVADVAARATTGSSSPLSDSGRVRARAVLLATGATYRRLGVPALEALNGAGVFYGGATSEAPPWPAETSTSSAARTQPDRLRCTSLATRGASRSSCAPSRSPQGCRTTWSARWRRRRSCEVRLGTEIVGGGGDGWLEHLVLRDARTGSEETVAADGLFLMIGARPHTDWLPPEVDRDEQGFVLTGTDLRDDRAWPLDRSPFLLETSMPGVFAAGDVRHGSVKRVASAVGEGSVAIQLLHRLFAADRLHPRGRPKEPAVVTER